MTSEFRFGTTSLKLRIQTATLLKPNSILRKTMSLSNKLAITDIADKIKGKKVLIRYIP
jgi:hypothetical protein